MTNMEYIDPRYTLRFFTRVELDGEIINETMIDGYKSDSYIPIPRVGETVVLDKIYTVTSVEYAYPEEDDKKYTYSVVVIVKEED